MRIIYLAIVLCAVMFSVTSCQKVSLVGHYDVAVTASFRGATYQYISQTGLAKAGTHYTISGYEGNVQSNTIQLTLDSAKTGTDSLLYRSGNSLQVYNNGTLYSSLNNHGLSAGIVNLIVSGNTVTGSFSGTLYTDSSTLPIDSLVITGGAISTGIYK